MPKKEHNAREQVRRNLIFYLTVKDKKSGSIIGELGDITENGLLIMSDQRFQITDTLNLAIELPKGPDYPARALDIAVEVQWAKRDPDNPDIFLAGCKIIKSKDSDRSLIQKLVEKIGFSNGQRKIIFNESEPDFKEYG